MGAGKIDLDDLRQHGQKDLAVFRQTRRNLWIEAGGSDEEFEANWPRIKAAYIDRKAEAAYARVRSPFS